MKNNKRDARISLRLALEQREAIMHPGLFVNDFSANKPDCWKCFDNKNSEGITIAKCTSSASLFDDKTLYFPDCYFCGNPIFEDDWHTGEVSGHKPCYKKCYEQRISELKESS